MTPGQFLVIMFMLILSANVVLGFAKFIFRLFKPKAPIELKDETAPKKEVAPRTKNENLDHMVKAVRRDSSILSDELRKRPSIAYKKLQILFFAVTQKHIQLDLSSPQKRMPVGYPTEEMEYVPVLEPSQMLDVPLEQMMLEDDIFYAEFVSQGLVATEYYDDRFKRLYILLDVSPSMTDLPWGAMTLPNGEAGLRDTWARAIVAGLLVEAVDGYAEYFLRPFAGNVHPAHSAVSKSEALTLLSWIVDNNKSMGGGTNIGAAVKTAVSDIRERQSNDVRMNHILLITDGDDNQGLNRQELETALGADIELHVVLIGTDYAPDHALAPYIVAKY